MHLPVREVEQRKFQANPKFEGKIGFFFHVMGMSCAIQLSKL